MLPEFPHGREGAGLAVLRNALAVILFLGASDLPPHSYSGVVVAFQILLVACLCMGIFTTGVAVLCGLCATAALFAAPAVPLEGAVEALSVSVSVALLGPGAYSIDSVWYGRRKRIFPPG